MNNLETTPEIEIPASTLAPVSKTIAQTVGELMAAALERRHTDAIARGRPRFTTDERVLAYTVVTRTLGLGRTEFLDMLGESGEESPYQRFEAIRAGYADDASAPIADDLALLDMQREYVDQEVRAAYDLEYPGPPAVYDSATRDELAVMASQVLRLASTKMFIQQEVGA